MKQTVPISEKVLLTLEEAVAYTGLGIAKLRAISDSPDCNFILYNGVKRMFKVKLFEQYLLSLNYSI